MRVDELHGHRALAHRGCAPLRRAGADVARGEDAGDARLEQVVGMRIRAREDEAVFVAGDGVAEPFGAWPRAEEQEQERERHALTTRERDRFEVPIRAV